MIYEIIKIHPKQKSINGNAFIRVEFKDGDGVWRKTDLCPDYRNYNRWKDLLVVGNKLTGLELKDDLTINADSMPSQYLSDEDLFRMGVIR